MSENPWRVTAREGECGLPGPCSKHGNYACDEIEPSGRSGPVRQILRDYVAPVETGEPFRSAAEAEWDDSRGDEW